MKNLLKAKRRQFNSKKGFTLVELIVAIMILLIVISATVRGLSISYRSAMMGAVKNDAQSVAQRNCDIIMTSIATIAENETFTPGTAATLNGRFIDRTSYCEIDSGYNSLVLQDTEMMFLNGGYDQDQYRELTPVNGTATEVETQKNYDKSTYPGKKYQYYTISREDKALKTSGDTYQIYTVTTYVYYTEKAFVTCEGEVCVLPNTT